MIKRYNKKILLVITSLLLFAFFVQLSGGVSAQSEQEKLEQLQNQIEQYEQEISRLKSTANTLSNQIAQFDAQIRLTTLKIIQTEEKIASLGGRIDRLEVSLQALTSAFSERATETYKMARVGEPLYMLLSASDLNGAISRYHYLQKIQEADRDLLFRLQKAQGTYRVEKNDQEDLQLELEEQKTALDAQKKAKAYLLEVTRNDEKKYQQLLAATRAEYEAIQAIIAGRGEETEIGKVSEGQRVASIHQGSSCNSSGSHLHFIVKQGTSALNPFAYLSNIDYENCSGSSCGGSDGDPFNPSGSWNWPISPKIKFNQGYGSTWSIANTWVRRIYSFHNGIDINSHSSSEVKAVKSGTLYQGSYSGSGCRLRYVRVDHDEADLETLYLHINY